MPGQSRGRGERRLEAALEALAGALNETRAPWMVIGGIAAIARGVRRMTTDIDVVVRGDAISLDTLLSTLAAWEIVPRVARARAFAKANLVLLVRHEPTGVELDVSLGWTEFEHQAIAASTSTPFGDVAAPMAQAQDLVIFKAVAARPKDIADATSLLLMHPSINLGVVRKRVDELAYLADDPSLLAAFEAMVASARPKRRLRNKQATAPKKVRKEKARQQRAVKRKRR